MKQKHGNRVFVLNMRGKPLMPCSQRKARILLKEGKAVIKRYDPFTIQLAYATVEVRQDVKSNIDAKRTYRRSRRNHKTRYRQERTLNRTHSKKESWLPPSIESRIDNTFRWIDTFCQLVPMQNSISKSASLTQQR